MIERAAFTNHTEMESRDAAVRRAPPKVREKINAIRRSRGLPELPATDDQADADRSSRPQR